MFQPILMDLLWHFLSAERSPNINIETEPRTYCCVRRAAAGGGKILGVGWKNFLRVGGKIFLGGREANFLEGYGKIFLGFQCNILEVRWQTKWGGWQNFLGGMAKYFGVGKQIKFCHPTPSQIFLPVNEIT